MAPRQRGDSGVSHSTRWVMRVVHCRADLSEQMQSLTRGRKASSLGHVAFGRKSSAVLGLAATPNGCAGDVLCFPSARAVGEFTRPRF